MTNSDTCKYYILCPVHWKRKVQLQSRKHPSFLAYLDVFSIETECFACNMNRPHNPRDILVLNKWTWLNLIAFRFQPKWKTIVINGCRVFFLYLYLYFATKTLSELALMLKISAVPVYIEVDVNWIMVDLNYRIFYGNESPGRIPCTDSHAH